jgi:hypothetical protein
MTPDELIKVLKQYLKESNQGERMLAARIVAWPLIPAHPFASQGIQENRE